MSDYTEKTGAGATAPTPATTDHSHVKTSPVVPVLEDSLDSTLHTIVQSVDAFLDACDSHPEPFDDSFDAAVVARLNRLNGITDALAELVRDWRTHILTSSHSGDTNLSESGDL